MTLLHDWWSNNLGGARVYSDATYYCPDLTKMPNNSDNEIQQIELYTINSTMSEKHNVLES